MSLIKDELRMRGDDVELLRKSRWNLKGLCEILKYKKAAIGLLID